MCFVSARIARNLNYELLEQLKRSLAANPRVAHETDAQGLTLLHHAVQSLPLEFCKLVIEQNPEALKSVDNHGALPFHYSCWANETETAKYLFQLYPECIDVADRGGNYPIHVLLYGDCDYNILEITQFLLQHDRGAVAKPNNEGYLPLHIAIEEQRGIDVVMEIFDAYPEATSMECSESRLTPLGLAIEMALGDVVAFFEHQLGFVRESEQNTQPDENMQLVIHCGLYNTIES